VPTVMAVVVLIVSVRSVVRVFGVVQVLLGIPTLYLTLTSLLVLKAMLFDRAWATYYPIGDVGLARRTVADVVPVVRERTDRTMKERLRGWARRIKRDVHALYLAARDPRVPWYAKAAAMAVAAYALSPIDLIPDFIPVVGYLDDLVIVPLGILLAVKLVPAGLMQEFRAAAASADGERALGKLGAAVVAMLWLVGIAVAAMWLRSLMR
jgi:uncharacterized membrane protein YkvA (DUF1232 family)